MDIIDRMKQWEDRRGNPTPGEILDEAAAEIQRLRGKVAALETCEAWLQRQVAERDAELAELRKTAAALMEIAASGADPLARRRMLDAMAMESFAENG